MEYFLILREGERRKNRGGWQRFREHFGFMCFSQGGVHQGRPDSSTDIIWIPFFSQAKYFLNDFENLSKLFALTIEHERCEFLGSDLELN